MDEYEIIKIELRDGSQGEFAIVDRFEYKEKNYVVVAQVKGDEIAPEGRYIYLAQESEDEITVTELTADIYEKVAEYYMSM